MTSVWNRSYCEVNFRFFLLISKEMSNFAAEKTYNEKIIMQNSANILITGATGFIGGFIVDKALEKGMNVWVAVRPTSSRKYLSDKRINFVYLDFDDESQMVKTMQGLRFDYVVHAAGVTKCINADDFYRVNTQGTKNLVEALLQLDMPLKRFVYVSSLSVFGNVREEYPHKDIKDTDTPRPNTNYGRSKLESEKYLDEMTAKGLPCIPLRPTGVYGPRETDSQPACGCCGGRQAADHHLRVCARRGAGDILGIGKRKDRWQVFPQRRPQLQFPRLQRPHLPRVRSSMGVAP